MLLAVAHYSGCYKLERPTKAPHHAASDRTHGDEAGKWMGSWVQANIYYRCLFIDRCRLARASESYGWSASVKLRLPFRLGGVKPEAPHQSHQTSLESAPNQPRISTKPVPRQHTNRAPNGTKSTPNGTKSVPNGTKSVPNGTKSVPNGGVCGCHVCAGAMCVLAGTGAV